MTSKQSVREILAESVRVAGQNEWEGTFENYLRLVTDDPQIPRLSHKLIYDSIIAAGVEESPLGEPVYKLFDDEIFGLEDKLERTVQYFASAANRLEIRKRILLLLGPPASGKSTIVALLKKALQDYTQSEQGTVYAIKGCPMQEEPLHLIPHEMRSTIKEQYGIHIEGDLCPKCRYILHSKYQGKIADMPITRVVFSEQEAIGIGFYIATNPNPSDASLLVGSIDTNQLEGDRLTVAGKAFRMDGEFNVANRGMVEFGEIFKADKHLLTTLLGLAQEQLIKMERFGSVYADEAIVAHSNEGDFDTFMSSEHSEALKDRIIAIQVPYNVRVRDEVRIYKKMLSSSVSQGAHLAPLTLSTISTYAVLSRLDAPDRQGMSLLDKLRAYDGRVVSHVSVDDVKQMMRKHPNEGMSGLSPRYVMNRLSGVASDPEISCLPPLRALNALWEGLSENVSLDMFNHAKFIGFVKDTVEEYGDLAVRDIQRAYKEGFEDSAKELLDDYLVNIEAFCSGREGNERDMRDMEKQCGVVEKGRADFRHQINKYFSNLKSRNVEYDHSSEHRLQTAIETRLFPDRRTLERALTKPRMGKTKRVEWDRQRKAIKDRLEKDYGYCQVCAEDVVDYGLHVLKKGSVVKPQKTEGIDWQWDLKPSAPSGIEDKD